MNKKVLRVLFIALSIFILSSTAIFASTERESNDSSDKANTIKIGETMYGELRWEKKIDREDYFYFKAPESGRIKLTAGINDYYNEFIDAGCFVVYDNRCNEKTRIEIRKNDVARKGVCTFYVTAGNRYYIQAYNSCPCDYKYWIYMGYNPDRTSISSVAPRTKGFKVYWNKRSNTSFYQVRYTTKISYGKYGWTKAKKVNVSNKYTAKTINNLSSKRYYYVSVRVGRTVDGKTYYSYWSDKKLVCTR